MPGYFGLMWSSNDRVKINSIVKHLNPMGNCEIEIIEKPGLYFVSTWFKEKPLIGDFYFENDKWILFFNGDLIHGPITLEDEGVPWGKISDIFEKQRYHEFQDLRGIFSISAYNKIEKNLFLITDRMGMSPLYYGKFKEGFCFTTSYSTFFCLQEDVKPDLRYFYDWLFFNFPVGSETLLQGVTRCDHAAFISFSNNGQLLSSQRYAQDFKANSNLIDGKEALAGAYEVFEKRLPPYFTHKVPMAAAITSGWDGLTNVAFKPPDLKNSTYTYGIKGAEDLIAGSKISKKLGLPHISFYFDEKIIKSLPNYSINAIQLSGGAQGVLRSTLLPVYQSLANDHKIRLVLSGIAASNILRGRSNTPSLISPGMRAILTKEKNISHLMEDWKGFFCSGHELDFISHIESRLKNLELQFGMLENIESQLLYHIYVVMPRYFGGEYNLSHNWVTLRIPFLDTDILNFIFSTKIAGLGFSEYATQKGAEHDERLLQAFLITKKNSRLRHTYVGNVTPSSILNGGIQLIFNKAFRKGLRAIKKPFTSIPPLENWDIWVDKVLNNLSEKLLKVPDARIYSIVNPESVTKLLKQENKNPIRTNMIGKLLTLEITLRLLENGWRDNSLKPIGLQESE